jgi:hypothetical protein
LRATSPSTLILRPVIGLIVCDITYYNQRKNAQNDQYLYCDTYVFYTIY